MMLMHKQHLKQLQFAIEIRLVYYMLTTDTKTKRSFGLIKNEVNLCMLCIMFTSYKLYKLKRWLHYRH